MRLPSMPSERSLDARQPIAMLRRLSVFAFLLLLCTALLPAAADELDEALRLRPDYATAHENLGDVYAALAARAYATSLRLEPGRTGVAPKLASVRAAFAASPAASGASAP